MCFGGHTEPYVDEAGKYRVRWISDRLIKAVPFDTPILGYRTNTANTLRLWKAEAMESFDFGAFNVGDYVGSVREKMQSENISKILYPNDEDIKGKELRLEQQYFFVSASLQDMIRIHLRQGRGIEQFDRKWAVQMNDTHPSVSVAELMRLLVDEHDLPWESAWQITQNTLGYTNHTLLPEALEKWSVQLFQRLLPRHLEIIYEINQRFLKTVEVRYSGDTDRLRRSSLIDESGERYVRMAHLAVVGSHAVNGVAALHTELLKKDVLHDLFEMYPERFSNKTNGVTPRRWLALSNPKLSKLITSRIGDSWIAQLDDLKRLEEYAGDAEFRKEWQDTQHQVKKDLVDYIEKKTGTLVDPSSMFDVMVKRIHEYKLQHLNALHIITLYNRIRKNPSIEITPRTFLFGGKAAPGYYAAKLIIKLINSVAATVNNHPDVAGRLRVVFLPDYNVTFGQHVYPAADLSEQISLAGKEASGTGNMKFALNEALDTIASGHFSRGDQNLFRPLLDNLLGSDPYMLLADYQSYIECQDHIGQVYRDRDHWARMSILNTARMGQ